ncbi:hypothetical protein [Helicobacter pylori]|uniref:hypothetical protein n=1 Tax=Helicobacter pylori TaxID=210 RepID=UPI001F51C37E|nr:hypothetical protein [Helicobacter pylori]
MDKETNGVIVQLNKETMVRLNSKTALANDNDLMAGIFDEFNRLKANKEPQNLTRSIMGMVALYR